MPSTARYKHRLIASRCPCSLIIVLLLLLFLFLVPSLPSLSMGTYADGQSSFRFQAKPEFMLLKVYTDGQIEGRTASFWQDGYISFVLGRSLGKDTIELSFFAASAGEQAINAAFKSPELEKCRKLGIDPACFLTLVHLALPKLGFQPLQTSIYRFQPKIREWVAEKRTSNSEYANFILEKDYDLGSAQAMLRKAKSINQKGSGFWSPVDDLFERDIGLTTAGLPPDPDVHFKTQYCEKISEELPALLRNGGKWEVSVSPEVDMNFSVRLKSHSDREFFYRDGYWWKAFFVISFREEDKDGNCSHATIYLYDSVVCGGPPDKDPDSTGRSQCFQRIGPDSKAEVDLRDHLIQIVQKSYGVPRR